jgi:phosphoglycolate phosphatase-like HAD superfamily hydrolase
VADADQMLGTISVRKTRVIVFDLDGVLVNSAPCHRAAFEQIFTALGIHDFEYSRFAGWRTRDVVERVLSCPAVSKCCAT